MTKVIYLYKADQTSGRPLAVPLIIDVKKTSMIDSELLLAHGAVYKKFKANEPIFMEGDACSYYHEVVTGELKLINIDHEGRECVHAIIEAGESFGEFPLFDDAPYAASAIAESECEVLRLHKPLFLEMLKGNPVILFNFARLLSKRLRFKYSVVKSMSSNSPETRIINLINYLKAENKNFCADDSQLKLTRRQIAGMTGLRVETVIRTIRQMHNKGELLISRGKVYCKDMLHTTTL